MQKEYKYKAFISYSHKDKKFAKWLHKRIENYKIPKSLKEKYPNLPKDLKHSIFREEAKLSTTSELGINLKYALDNSEWLIVICSPHAAASKWVDNEIHYFKKMHGEKFVLAMLISGEVKASKSFIYDSSEEAFPKTLLYTLGDNGKLTDKETEPLSGDARSYWAKEMALIKMIAGILGVDFADLWAKEKRERLKRRIIGGGIFFSFLVLTFYINLEFIINKETKLLNQSSQVVGGNSNQVVGNNTSISQSYEVNTTKIQNSTLISGDSSVINNNYFSKEEIKFNEKIYKAEWKAIVLYDKRASKLLTNYYKKLASSFTYREGKVKKNNKESEKDKCKIVMGIKKSKKSDIGGSDMMDNYMHILGHKYNKTLYSDKNSQNIIKQCTLASKETPLDADYLYYVSIGYHMAVDYSNAVKNLKLAIEKGSLDAERKLAIIYLTGSILPQDKNLGKKYLINAATSGDTTSKYLLDNIDW